MDIKSLLLFLAIPLFIKCTGKEQRCETYECRRKNMEIFIDSDELYVDQPTNLIVNRKEIYKPKFRVFMGDSSFNYDTSGSEIQQYFEGTDSTASTVLIFESSGEKIIKGTIVEYQTISEDSDGQWVSSYDYPFEITVKVKEHADK